MILRQIFIFKNYRIQYHIINHFSRPIDEVLQALEVSVSIKFPIS